MRSASPFSKLSSSSKQWLAQQFEDPLVKRRLMNNSSFRSGSVYKLLEMEDKFQLLGYIKNQNHLHGQPRVIIDLGAAPGGWSQIIALKTGHSIVPTTKKNLPEELPFGLREKVHVQDVPDSDEKPSKPKLPTIIALDLLRMSPVDGAISLQADFLSSEAEASIVKHFPPEYGPRPVDLLFSDIAGGNTIGSFASESNVAYSLEICKAVFGFACRRLSPFRYAKAPGGVMILRHLEHPDLKKFYKDCLRPSFRAVHTFEPSSGRRTSLERYWVCFGFKGLRSPIISHSPKAEQHDLTLRRFTYGV